MSGKTPPPAQLSIPALSFYGESPPKRSRLQDTGKIRPVFRSLKSNLIEFDKRLSEPSKGASGSITANVTTPSLITNTVPTTTTTRITCSFATANTLISAAKSSSTERDSSTTTKSTSISCTIKEDELSCNLRPQESDCAHERSPLVATVAGQAAPTALVASGCAEQAADGLDRDSPIPLKNLGNTCYENSIIQCLFSLNMFMDNFEQSMNQVRRLIVKPKPTEQKTPDDTEPSSSSGIERSQTLLTTYSSICAQSRERDQDNNTGSSATIPAPVSDKDVRFRIADAFYNLYISYTRKRHNNEPGERAPNASPSNAHQSTDQTQQLVDVEDVDSSRPVESDKSRVLAIANNDTNSNSQPLKATIVANTNETHPNVTASLNNDMPTIQSSSTDYLSPIALVSSSAATLSEQSEIETRLEDLKSAVGERSSQFNSTHQQDASEFFYHVIDSIQEFYQSLNKNEDDVNPVTKAFELELDYLIRCPKCHHRVLTEPEKVRTLPLALPHINSQDNNSEDEQNDATAGIPTPPTSDLGLDSPVSYDSDDSEHGGKSRRRDEAPFSVINSTEGTSTSGTMSIAKLDLSDKSERKSAPQLELATNKPQSSSQDVAQPKKYTLCDALNNYFKDDLLDYACSQTGCDSKQRTKKCQIRKLPQILFITLARYSYTGKKNLDEVEAPFELTVPFREHKSPSHSPSAHKTFSSEDDNRYRLVAVVCHLGSSLNAGHYTSYVYYQNTSSWYSCDDDSITKVHEDEVKKDASKSGYCFFYAHNSCLQTEAHEQVVKSKSPPLEIAQAPITTLRSSDDCATKSINVMVGPQVVESSTLALTPDSSPTSMTQDNGSELLQDDDNESTCNQHLAEFDDWS